MTCFLLAWPFTGGFLAVRIVARSCRCVQRAGWTSSVHQRPSDVATRRASAGGRGAPASGRDGDADFVGHPMSVVPRIKTCRAPVTRALGGHRLRGYARARLGGRNEAKQADMTASWRAREARSSGRRRRSDRLGSCTPRSRIHASTSEGKDSSANNCVTRGRVIPCSRASSARFTPPATSRARSSSANASEASRRDVRETAGSPPLSRSRAFPRSITNPLAILPLESPLGSQDGA